MEHGGENKWKATSTGVRLNQVYTMPQYWNCFTHIHNGTLQHFHFGSDFCLGHSCSWLSASFLAWPLCSDPHYDLSDFYSVAAYGSVLTAPIPWFLSHLFLPWTWDRQVNWKVGWGNIFIFREAGAKGLNFILVAHFVEGYNTLLQNTLKNKFPQQLSMQKFTHSLLQPMIQTLFPHNSFHCDASALWAAI